MIKQHSYYPGLDLVRFYELKLFSFLIGNADMHLKNFSMISKIQGHYELAPAYDLVPSALVVAGDDEELALILNGKKKRLRSIDFYTAMATSGLPKKTAENIMNKYRNLPFQWSKFLDESFLSEPMKKMYKELIVSKQNQLYS